MAPADDSNDNDVDTQDKVLLRLKNLSEMSDLPVFTTSLIAEPLPVTDQTVRGHLLDLSDDEVIRTENLSGTRFWWLPEDEGGTDEIDFDGLREQMLDYESINPDEVPHEVAIEIAEAQIPGFEKPTDWTRFQGGGETLIGIGFTLILFGLGASGAQLLSTVWVARLFVAGIVIGMLGILVLFLGRIGIHLSAAGIVKEEPISFRIRNLRD